MKLQKILGERTKEREVGGTIGKERTSFDYCVLGCHRNLLIIHVVLLIFTSMHITASQKKRVRKKSLVHNTSFLIKIVLKRYKKLNKECIKSYISVSVIKIDSAYLVMNC